MRRCKVLEKPAKTINTIDCKTVHIFAYSSTREQSNRMSGTRLKTERDWGERVARFACKTLTPRFTNFFSDFEKKTYCFAVYKHYENCKNYTTCARPSAKIKVAERSFSRYI